MLDGSQLRNTLRVVVDSRPYFEIFLGVNTTKDDQNVRHFRRNELANEWMNEHSREWSLQALTVCTEIPDDPRNAIVDYMRKEISL